MTEPAPKPEGYDELLTDLVGRVREAQVRAAQSVNRELVQLYWGIGRDILARQAEQGWGAKVIDRIAADLRKAVPGIRGFSVRNLRYMRALAEAWPDEKIVQQLLHKLPWGHLVRLHDKVKDPAEREWYARACLEHGWSRNILEMQIATGLYHRQGKAITNFERTLPTPQSDLAQQLMKDPYNFDFLMLADDARERQVEQGLIDHLQRFLLELGVGFAFLGRQQRFEVEGDEFFIDLLFYHVKLHCYVVVELKATDFQPTFAGQLNFYVNAVNNLMREPGDKPTIGLLLCRGKKPLVAEWSLQGIDSAIGVSDYQLTESLPDELKGKLPTIEELEHELAAEEDEDES